MNGRIIGYLLEKVAEEPILPGMKKSKPLGGNSDSDQKAAPHKTALADSLRIKQGPLPELTCGSSGVVNTRPLIMRDDNLGLYIAWTTSKGMFVGHIGHQDENSFPLLYELSGGNEIVARPCYMPPRTGKPDMEGTIFVAAINGSIFAHSERHERRTVAQSHRTADCRTDLANRRPIIREQRVGRHVLLRRGRR